jgi:hypothetical protein
MILTPRRQHPKCLALFIRLHQIRKAREGEGDVVHPRPLADSLLGLSAGIGDEGDAVILIVVLEECEGVVLEYDSDAEGEGLEVDLALEVGGAEDDVGEGDGVDDFVASGFDWVDMVGSVDWSWKRSWWVRN